MPLQAVSKLDPALRQPQHTLKVSKGTPLSKNPRLRPEETVDVLQPDAAHLETKKPLFVAWKEVAGTGCLGFRGRKKAWGFRFQV